MLEIKNLHVSSEAALASPDRSFGGQGKEILKGVTLKIKPGEIHALMGPNGSGKSSLSLALAGHPRYKITSGNILLDRKDITMLTPDKRAKLGLFLAMQYPVAVPGVSVTNFLRSSLRNLKGKVKPAEFVKTTKEKMVSLKIDESFARRSINDGFSGGEKKKMEVLQLTVLQPKYAVLDETDSGLDIDALKLVASGIKKASGPKMGILLITHYQRILKYIKPDYVHVLIDGKIVKSGSYKLAVEIEEGGYAKI
ncbi:Fe-S cluster assembly ATPase SufC [Patescibacteria group bacterium]|nr:Fe-S cluster assembly ATPase SufC [Patescibacteria group bacterium]